MKSLGLTLFGVFRIHNAMGKKLDIVGSKASLLLAYLALQLGTPQSREKLMGLLWSDRGESQARGSLRQALWAIRRALENIDPNPLIIDGDTVALDPTAIDADLIDFEELLADGSADSLQTALELYRGEFLEGAHPRDPVFEELLRSERLRLHQLAVDACSRLLEHQCQAGMTRSAMHTAKRLLSIDSLQESAHRMLMQHYADSGQLGLALKQYQNCRESLQRELNVAPQEETERLISQIREARPTASELVFEQGEPTEPLSTNPPSGKVALDTNTAESKFAETSLDGLADSTTPIICPRCQHENSPIQNFCGDCGKSLTYKCTSCNSINPPGQNFCGKCGTALSQNVTPSRFHSPDSYTPKHLTDKILTYKNALEGERKQVTVIFTELVGSMQLVADRDPEEARAILDPILEAMIDAVQRYGGIVSKVLGDGITALFGVPLAREDHAVRACYSALAIREAVSEKSASLLQTQPLELKARIGINSGEIVVGGINKNLSVDYDAIGPTTLLAGKMEQLAKPNSIRLTHETLRLAEGFIQVKQLASERLQGLKHPIQTFELEGATTSRSRFHATVLRGLTQFVGRDTELDALGRAVKRATQRQGQVFAIVGEPGVGKSRLLYEFILAHGDMDWLILESRSASYDKTTPYLPVIDLLKEYFQIADLDEPQAIRDKISAKLLTTDQHVEPTYTALLSLLQVPVEDSTWHQHDPHLRRQQTQDAVKRLLLRESENKPLLLIFEDLQWTDSETQALLDDLVESLPSATILLIVSYRPEYSHDWSNKTYYTQRRIDPLPLESSTELLRSLMGSATELAPLKQSIINRTEGNPFFVEESVRTLVESGLLQGNQGSYSVNKELDSIDVPASVQGVLVARIDRLPPGDKQLLQTASVIGGKFSFALLSAITGQTDKILQDCLVTLRSAEFIYETRLFPDLEYTFKHALTHDVAYATLLKDQRSELHTRILEAIKQLYADRLTEHVERLAHHAFYGKQWAQAVDFLRQSGNKSTKHGSYREAVNYFEKALLALGHLPDSRESLQQNIDLRFDLRSTLQALGEHDRVFDTLRQAEKIASSLDDQDRLGWSSAYLSQYLWRMGDAKQAEKMGKRALKIAARLSDFSLEVVTNFFLGQGYFNIGDYAHAIDHCRQNIVALKGNRSHERLGLTGLPAVLSRIWLAWSLAERGEFIEAMELAQEALSIAEAAEQVYSVAAARLGIGQVQCVKGDLAQAIPMLKQAAELCETWNLGVILPSVTALLSLCYALNGQATKFLTVLEESEKRAPQIRIFRTPSEATALGVVYLQAKKAEEASDVASRAAELAKKSGFEGTQAKISHLLGDVNALLNPTQLVQNQRYYLDSLRLAKKLGMLPLIAHCHLGLGRSHLNAGNYKDANLQLKDATNLYRKLNMNFWLSQAQAAPGNTV